MSWNDLNEVSQQTEKIMPWTVRHSLSLKYGAPNGIVLFGQQNLMTIFEVCGEQKLGIVNKTTAVNKQTWP